MTFEDGSVNEGDKEFVVVEEEEYVLSTYVLVSIILPKNQYSKSWED